MWIVLLEEDLELCSCPHDQTRHWREEYGLPIDPSRFEEPRVWSPRAEVRWQREFEEQWERIHQLMAQYDQEWEKHYGQAGAKP